MMLNKKQSELLSKLYALRAGLSVVAQEKEQSDGIMNDAAQALQNAQDSANRATNRAKEYLQHVRGEYSACNIDINRNKEIANSPDRRARILHAVLVTVPYIIYIFLTAGLVIIPVFVVLSLMFNFTPTWVPEWWPIFFFIPVPFVLLVKKATGSYRNSLEYLYSLNDRDKAIRELQRLGDRQKLLGKDIAEAEENIVTVHNENKTNLAQAQAAYEEKKSEAILHAQTGVTLIDGLNKTFGSLIDKRDWENLDIILYSIETRRADSFKEALAIVDRERHTERITETIALAGQEICQSIGAGLDSLQAQMATGFSLLSQQINIHEASTSLQFSHLSDQLALQIEGVTSQVNMQNALVAKANTSSKELNETAKNLEQRIRSIQNT